MCLNITGDKKFFVQITNNGFKVYSVKNIELQYEEEELGPIEKVEILGKSNIYAILPSSDNIQFPNRKIIIWDCKNKKKIYELDFKHKVRSFKFFPNVFVVCTSHNITIFKLFEFNVLDSFVTYQNKKGAFAFHSNGNNYLCCYPADSDVPGYVTLFYSEKKITITQKVHQSDIHHIVLNEDGNKLLTCSGKGTVIRYYTISKKGFHLEKELRRGYEHAEIYSMSISPNSQWLNITSEKGTGHVFFIGKTIKESTKNQTSIFSYGNILPSVLPFYISEYISSEWSCYQYTTEQMRNISFIFDDHKILVINTTGVYSYYSFNPKISGDIKLTELKEFMK